MNPTPRRPGKRTLLLVLGGGGAVAVVAFLVIYFLLFPTSSPKPFRLSASPAASATTGRTNTASTSSTAARTPGSSTATAGRWTIASGSRAGYRVREKLGFLPAQSDAVGRTAQITGSATFAEAAGKLTIRAASFDVAVNTLKSDRAMRDEKIHQIGLESDRYPSATFALASPVSVESSALSGKVAHLSVTGTFTIHGVSRKETLPVEMSLSGSTFQAAGALTFPWSEFGMSAPSIGGFVNVTGKATMEFELRMTRSA